MGSACGESVGQGPWLLRCHRRRWRLRPHARGSHRCVWRRRCALVAVTISIGAPVVSSPMDESDACWSSLRAAFLDGSNVVADLRDDAGSVLEGARPDTSLAVSCTAVGCVEM